MTHVDSITPLTTTDERCEGCGDVATRLVRDAADVSVWCTTCTVGVSGRTDAEVSA